MQFSFPLGFEKSGFPCGCRFLTVKKLCMYLDLASASVNEPGLTKWDTSAMWTPSSIWPRFSNLKTRKIIKLQDAGLNEFYKYTCKILVACGLSMQWPCLVLRWLLFLQSEVKSTTVRVCYFFIVWPVRCQGDGRRLPYRKSVIDILTSFWVNTEY